MLLVTILLMCPFPQTGDVVKPVVERPASVSMETAKDSSLSDALPAVPEPKIKTDEEVESDSSSATANATPGAAGITPANPSLSLRPVKPAGGGEYGTGREKKIWYSLIAASSTAAAFDAWSTRRAVSGGYGTEGNPFLRPFSHSKAMYAATQVSPVVMDFIGRKMMTSRYSLFRRTWWLPQSLGTSMSVAAGVHNVGVVPSN